MAPSTLVDGDRSRPVALETRLRKSCAALAALPNGVRDPPQSASSLTTGDPANQFVDHEMWYGLNATFDYWVEVGFTDGETYAGGQVDTAFFWADNRNGGGYHEHYPSATWTFNNYYTVKVTRSADSTWDVYLNGIDKGTSTNNPAGANRNLEAGIEATRADQSDHVGGHLTNWRRKDGNDNWYSDWDNATTWAYCPADINRNGSTTMEVLHGLI